MAYSTQFIILVILLGIAYYFANKKYPEQTKTFLNKAWEITKIISIKTFEILKIVSIKLYELSKILLENIWKLLNINWKVSLISLSVIATILFFVFRGGGPGDRVVIDKLEDSTSNTNGKMSVDYSKDTGVVLGEIDKDGVSVFLPAGALDNDTKLNIEPSRENLPPISIEGIVPLSQPVDITLDDGKTQFNEPAIVVMNLDLSKLPEDTDPEDIYMTFYNKETKEWEFFTPDDVNLETGQVTFSTDHFTDFVPASYNTSDLVASLDNETSVEKETKTTSSHLIIPKIFSRTN